MSGSHQLDMDTPDVILPHENPLALTTKGTVERKRRRVLQACDECRKRKVRCDGRQPCSHCTAYNNECVFSRGGAAKRTEESEEHPELLYGQATGGGVLLELAMVVQALLPDVSVLEATFDLHGFAQELGKIQRSGTNIVDVRVLAQRFTSQEITLAPPTSAPIIPLGPVRPPVLEIEVMLPPKDVTLQLVSYTWLRACVLFRFYHRPTFIQDLDVLYETDPADYTPSQMRFLLLVYLVVACGLLFVGKEKASVYPAGDLAGRWKDGLGEDDEGFRYFVAARKLIDLTEVRDTFLMQTMLMLILYLQCLARLSTCYLYIGIALRLALREGMHRKLYHPRLTRVEIEVRKRIFYTIYKLDIYINAMLGLPRAIAEEDFDQELPMEVDDENIGELEYLPQMPPDKVLSAGVANAHTRLMLIMDHSVRRLYPVRPRRDDVPDPLMDRTIVQQLELEFVAWEQLVPASIRPTQPVVTQEVADPKYLRATRYLHLAYLHCKTMLYRPYIHYILPQYLYNSLYYSDAELHLIVNARKCINVAIQVVSLAERMMHEGVLSAPYWFSNYTIFFLVACLVFYVHTCTPEKYLLNPLIHSILVPQWHEVAKVVQKGKAVLGQLRGSSTAAERTYILLNPLFEHLNRKLEEIRPAPPGKRLLPGGTAAASAKSLPGFAGLFPLLSSGDADSAPELLYQIPVEQPENTAAILSQGAATPSGQVTATPARDSYAPGAMDLVEMQVFGRFLPPYMLHRTDLQTKSGGPGRPGQQGSEMPVGLTTMALAAGTGAHLPDKGPDQPAKQEADLDLLDVFTFMQDFDMDLMGVPEAA